MTSSTSVAFVLPRFNTSFIVIAPRSAAGTFESVPLKLPIQNAIRNISFFFSEEIDSSGYTIDTSGQLKSG